MSDSSPLRFPSWRYLSGIGCPLVLPSRALTQEPVEALRTLFLDDLLSRPLTPDKQTGGLVD